jgi:hypothetical protein
MQEREIRKIANGLKNCCEEQPLVWYREGYAIARCPVCLRWKLIGKADIDKKMEEWNDNSVRNS